MAVATTSPTKTDESSARTAARGREATSAQRAAAAPHLSQKPWLTTAVIIAVDVVSLAAAMSIVVIVRWLFGGEFHPSLYFQLWPVLFAFVAVFAIFKTYVMPLNPPGETRQICVATALVYLGLGSVIYLLRLDAVYSRSIFLAAWPVSIVAVLEGRWLVRGLLARKAWWGAPVVIVGCGRVGRHMLRTLKSMPEFGLKPVGVLEDRPWRSRGYRGVAHLGGADDLAALAAKRPRITFILVAADIPVERLRTLLLRDQQHVANLVLVPNLHAVRSLDSVAQNYGGMLGLRINHRLLDPGHMTAKRIIDLALVAALSPIILALTAVIAIAIKLNSRGPVFFKHERIGRGGVRFHVWKFRTMVHEADERLEQYLNENPSEAQQWRADHKLKEDFRVTAVGKLLRRLSLDELPQIWNVVRGEMSVVGPRPIVDEEVTKYGGCIDLYYRVRPGITGLWQISGRNDLRYPDRVWLDEHYVRNWSVWLDLFILSRTATVVLLGRGAY